MKRKYPLAVGQIYHVLNKSIAGYQIFNLPRDYERFLRMLDFFSFGKMPMRFGELTRQIESSKEDFDAALNSLTQNKEKRIDLIAYCIMPTHIHLVIKEIRKDGISKFTGDLLNSYSKYFNQKHKRQGPLWSGPFKNVPVETDEQLLHLTRYIHLNPVTANLIDQPKDWPASSYLEYIDVEIAPRCNFKNLITLTPALYSKFVLDRVSYQRELAKIKALMLE